MLYLKTATLIEAAAKAAAMIDNKESQIYALYGRNLGLSFQIIDDILDITSDSQTLGKPAMNDYVEGKCTLPYIYLYEALDMQEREKLVSFHGKTIEEDETVWIQEKMAQHACVEKSFKIAQELSQEAKNVLHDNDELVAILDTMIKRSY